MRRTLKKVLPSLGRRGARTLMQVKAYSFVDQIMAMWTEQPTKLAKIPFTEGSDPEELRKECMERQTQWKNEWSSSDVLKDAMDDYAKEKALDFVWLSNELEGTLVNDSVSQWKAYDALDTVYDSVKCDKEVEEFCFKTCDISNASQLACICQLSHHLLAYKELCQRSIIEEEILSEQLIKKVHKMMMQDLTNESGNVIHAGEYRQIAVHAGKHTYPSHECIPEYMAKIVRDYNEKASKPHDPFQLASWLHYHVVSLHPFEDGNGRVSRLLSCYSLMRDGLPFPVTQTSGHKRSQKHLVWCLERDRRPLVTDQPHLTSLTVFSVNKAWNDFVAKLNLDHRI